MHRAAHKPNLSPPPDATASFWRSTTMILSLASSLLLWAAFPPLDWWPLAWIAPLPWLWLIQLPQLPGRRPYLAIWLTGFVHWLLLLQGIRLAHPALYGGWIALAWYLAFYLPVFVGLTRVAVHRLNVSIVFAAPVVWVGLELIRGYLLTGFSLALVSHTQTRWTMLLQISDLAGAYAVSFVILTVAACLARVVQLELDGVPILPRTLNPALIAAALLGLTLAYGAWRLGQSPAKAEGQPVRVALIQGSRDTKLEYDPDYFRETFEQYQRLTDQARRANERLDLVIWPESMFVVPESLVVEPLDSIPGREPPLDELRSQIDLRSSQFEEVLAGEAARINAVGDGGQQPTPALLLVGTTTFAYGPSQERPQYNCSLLADPSGKIVARYYKMHPVMFGEYIPLGDLFPWIYALSPIGSGLSVGDGSKVFEVGELRLSPSICFESVVPHLIRGQVVELNRRGTEPDVLVNVTNDGWFWGSAILDLHLRCAIFRAIENRKPTVIAANTGISAWIDGNGAILAQGPRRAPEVLIAEVRPDGRTSLYHRLGDLPAWLCAAACLCLAIVGWRKRSPDSVGVAVRK